MKPLIVCYSYTGHTREAALRLQSLTRRGSVPDLPQAALSCALPTTAGAGSPGDRSRRPAPAAGDGAGTPALPGQSSWDPPTGAGLSPRPWPPGFPTTTFPARFFFPFTPTAAGCGETCGRAVQRVCPKAEVKEALGLLETETAPEDVLGQWLARNVVQQNGIRGKRENHGEL